MQLARTAVIQAYREAGTDGPVDVRTYVRVGDSLLIDFGDTTQAALHVRGGSARAIVVRDSLVRVELGQ